MMGPLGLLAGNGRFPFLVAQEARKEGRPVIAAAFHGEADPAIEQVVDRLYWVAVGQFNKWIQIFKSEGVKEVVMAGLVRHSNMYEDFKRFHPDLRALRIFFKAPDRRADTLLGAVGEEMKKEGLTLVPSVLHLKKYLAAKGILTKRKPNSKEKADIDFGYQVAKKMAGSDIGQTVCVKNKAVIAVEAMEGTDNCIRRAGGICHGDFVVVKVAKPRQDLRFDVPIVGLNTIETFQESGGGILAVEAGKTLVLDPERMLEWANNEKIGIVGVEPQ